MTKKLSEQSIRLNKLIANSGICSRRKADELIKNGTIKINDQVIKTLGYKVAPNDTITYNGKEIKKEKTIYILLNKPKDCITTAKDTHGRKTVLDIFKNKFDERLFPVGRLDRNTTGLLILTNDGNFCNYLSHPSNKIRKIYEVFLDKEISLTEIENISKGMQISEDIFLEVDYIQKTDVGSIYIEIHSGQNRIIKRLFEKLGYKVMKLDRLVYGNLDKKNLPRGEWRHLNAKEVKNLQSNKLEIKR